MSMKENIKKMREKNIVVRLLWNSMLVIKFSLLDRTFFFIKSTLTYLFSDNSKKIKEYHNAYKGKRCFIIATGPSLTYEDLDLLKDEYTFGMNSLILALDKTQWRPTFFGIQDEHVYDRVSDALIKSGLENVFVSDSIARRYRTSSNWITFQLDSLNQRVQAELHDKYYTKFSKNFAYKAFNGYTITYSLIQLAYYMGFKEIYLLGCDCNYESGKPQHFIEHGHYDPTFEKAKDRMLVSYKEAKKFADSSGLSIYNATRGGMLEVFPRVELESILSKGDS